MASSMWGDVFAASHAAGRRLERAGVLMGRPSPSANPSRHGPDLTLGRSMQDDVRPLLVDANGRWNGRKRGRDRYATLREPCWIRRRVRPARPRTQPHGVTYHHQRRSIRVDASSPGGGR